MAVLVTTVGARAALALVFQMAAVLIMHVPVLVSFVVIVGVLLASAPSLVLLVLLVAPIL